MQEPEVARTVHIQLGEVAANISYQQEICLVECAVKSSFIERECQGLEDKQIAIAALQFIVQRDGIFVAGNPSLKLTTREPNSDWNFTARFPVLLKPVLDPYQLVEELKNSLSEEDLESEEECKKRLLAIVESKITYPLPQEFLANSKNPVETISIWKQSIAKASLAEMNYPLANPNSTLEDKTSLAINWMISNTIKQI